MIVLPLGGFSDEDLELQMALRRTKRLMLHLNIPVCCVEFFCKYLSVEWPPDSRVELYREAVFVSGWKGEYLPCFDCWVGNRHVKIHRCVAGSQACREMWVDGKPWPIKGA